MKTICYDLKISNKNQVYLNLNKLDFDIQKVYYENNSENV